MTSGQCKAITLFVVSGLNFAYLDLGRDSFRFGVMGAIRRTINLIIVLVLAALGCGGLVHFCSSEPPATAGWL